MNHWVIMSFSFIDYHIHTNHSIDAEGSLKEYCQQAINLGLKEICFTDHCELDPKRSDSLIRFEGNTQPLTNDALKKLQVEVNETKEIFKKSGLKVKFGLEIGYYEGIESRLKETLQGLELDFLLGSIHCLAHICIDSSREYELYFKRKNVLELLNNYYAEIEKLINSQLFDGLAHLDVYKKYGTQFYGAAIKNFPQEILNIIFKTMTKNGLALEINTAGLRRQNEFYPSPQIMALAKNQKIKLITIGSDCHKIADLGRGIKEAFAYAESFGLDTVSGFEKRKPGKSV